MADRVNRVWRIVDRLHRIDDDIAARTGLPLAPRTVAGFDDLPAATRRGHEQWLRRRRLGAIAIAGAVALLLGLLVPPIPDALLIFAPAVAAIVADTGARTRARELVAEHADHGDVTS